LSGTGFPNQFFNDSVGFLEGPTMVGRTLDPLYVSGLIGPGRKLLLGRRLSPRCIPSHPARFFHALDHVTRGRIAWNAVTSAYENEAANYGFEVMMDHDDRYLRAQEFLEVA
jgi:Luciferase-like monooxygenase